MLDNTLNQPTKFRTKNWVGINDHARGTYNTNSQTKFETSMLRLSLCDYSGTITVVGNSNIRVVFKTFAPFTNCISEIIKTQIDNAKDLDIVIPMHNLIEPSDNYSKTSGSL